MLKNKLKIIAMLTLIVLALTVPIVRAENETPAEVTSPPAEETNEKAPDGVVNSEVNPEVTNQTTTEDNFKKHDVYLTGDNVTVDYIVDGNLFIFANHVTINSQIGGDAFICANTVTVGEQGYVFSNLFTLSKEVHITGVVYDLYAAAENTTITGYVYRDVHVGADTVNIFGTVGRNAFVDCANFSLVKNAEENNEQESTENKQGSINGSLKYSANTEASIPEGAVSGETNFEQAKSFSGNNLTEKIMDLGTFVITVIAVWLICLWLAPKFLKNTTTLLTSKKVLPVIGLGILTPIVAVLATVLFFVLGITSTLGLLAMLIITTLVAISTAMFIITVNQIICQKLKIEKTIGIFGMLVVCAIALWLVGLIPFVGPVLGLVVVILGLGIIASSLVLKKKD